MGNNTASMELTNNHCPSHSDLSSSTGTKLNSAQPLSYQLKTCIVKAIHDFRKH